MDPTNAVPGDACKAFSMVETAVAKCQAAAVELAAVATKEEESRAKGSGCLEAAKEMASAAQKLAAAAYEVAAAKRMLHDVTRALAEAATADATASTQALVDLLDEDDEEDDDDSPISDEVAAATALASDAIVRMATTQALAVAAGKEAAAALSFASASATFAASPTDFRAFSWEVDLKEEEMFVPWKAFNIEEAAEDIAANTVEGARRILAKILGRRPPPPLPPLRDRNQKTSQGLMTGVEAEKSPIHSHRAGRAGVEAAKSLHRAALLIQRQMAREGHVLSLEQALRIVTSPPDLYPPFIPTPEHPVPPEHVCPHVILPTPPPVIMPPRVLLPDEFKIPQVPPQIPEVPPMEKKPFDWLKVVRRTIGTALVKIGLDNVFKDLKDYKPDWRAFGKPSVDETPEPPEDIY